MTEFITTGFSAHSTAAEVIEGIDLRDRRAIVTGASSGIGMETARVLAGAGVEVTLAVRDVESGCSVAESIAAETGSRVNVERLDLSDLASVADFAAAWHGPLHILVNNAGVMALPDLCPTADGWEMQFGTNHIGHFALAHGLHAALAAAGAARVVTVSSVGHMLSPVVFDDINFRQRAYNQWAAYGQSKTANSLFAVAAAHRWAGDGITVNAVHPGAIAQTGLTRHLDPDVLRRARSRASGDYLRKSVEQGAATSVLVAASPDLDGVTGRYFEDCSEAESVDTTQTDAAQLARRRSGVADYALDRALAEQLWELSVAAIGQAQPNSGARTSG
ncbi:SDR family NAD(P)-dependent oxidoreductase [Gordonia rhizosphera]|uniref:Probable oxidoreductase n=1 Tax=Gordonia rhizosphera NBRC 16068 TaxID=1108045 RepID=K6UYI4_9ACTN|nr:SDR family NAD(P)-dependent oxidoreductase [Gordonia rhizosphera]GAB88503.1 putative oxidoreductase [Gordonia rhizosphera NBRC 16068]